MFTSKAGTSPGQTQVGTRKRGGGKVDLWKAANIQIADIAKYEVLLNQRKLCSIHFEFFGIYIVSKLALPA